ncbi:hypothetical protein QBC40DRAFT_162483 [Triangularia verruculosa]|uniref:Uncharacterized protein n=1 Tax=Triangularia verruculosa TaxID=2587418 RepID=A0AAN6XRG7_9PEZI|nr:hypothetical protein QBC40DRAFT_162483 [Triangularia verruculosa]
MIATKSIIAYFAIGALSVTAAPSNTFKVERSANAATVFACTEARFTGDCRTIDSPAGQCFNIDAAWNDVISSIQNLERDRFSCKWFEHRDCEGKEYKNQDDADLTDEIDPLACPIRSLIKYVNGFFDDRITSWLCERK